MRNYDTSAHTNQKGTLDTWSSNNQGNLSFHVIKAFGWLRPGFISSETIFQLKFEMFHYII